MLKQKVIIVKVIIVKVIIVKVKQNIHKKTKQKYLKTVGYTVCCTCYRRRA